MQKDSIIAYLTVAIATLVAITGLLSWNVTMLSASLLLALFSIVAWRMWYVFDSLIFRHTNIIQVLDGCELSKARVSAIRRLSNKVIATTAAIIEVEGQSGLESSKIESIVAHTGYTFRFSIQVERQDIKKLLDALQTKRGMLEIAISRLRQSKDGTTVRINQLQRHLEQVERDIKSVSSGETPLRMVCYIVTSSLSDSVYRAEERALSQIRELSSQFDALTGGHSVVLSGDQLLRILKIDAMVGWE